MALPLTIEEQALIDPIFGFPEPANAQVTPQSFFDLPPPMPTTSFFGSSRSRFGGGMNSRDPYGLLEKAAEYRQKITAEQEAQELMQVFNQIDPANPDYPRQRLALVARLPLAGQDPRGKAMWEAADMRYRQAQQRPPDQAFLERVSMEGVTPQEVEQYRMPDGSIDRVALGNLASQKRLANRPERADRDRTIADLTAQYKALDEARGVPGAKEERDRIGQLIVEASRQRSGGGGAAPAAAPTIPVDDIPTISSAAEAAALPSGSRFRTPTGQIKFKP